MHQAFQSAYQGSHLKDADDIRFGLDNDIDFIAASFVRKAQDGLDIREILEEKRHDTCSNLP